MKEIEKGFLSEVANEIMADQRRIFRLEAALREIEREADKANADGGDDLLTLLAGTARDALRNSTPAT